MGVVGAVGAVSAIAAAVSGVEEDAKSPVDCVAN